MSNKTNPKAVVSDGIGKGCLAGVVLAAAFSGISGIVYLLLGLLAIESNVRLLLTVASGPVLGTGLVLTGFYVYSMRASQNDAAQ